MSTNSDSHETELVERALQLCTSKYTAALGRRLEVNKEIEQLERKMKSYQQLISSTASAARKPDSLNRERAPGGKMRPNHAEAMFIELLRAKAGVGATLEELIQETGASVATAYRVIGRLKKDQKVTQDRENSHWYWAAE